MLSKSIKVLQANLNRSAPATESALQLAIELKVDLLIVQEPWLIPNNQDLDYTNTRSISHQGFTQILPHYNTILRPRTLVYISRSFFAQVNLSSISPQDPDLLILDIKDKNLGFQLFNIYNEKDQSNNTSSRTLERVLYPQTLSTNSLVLGDFNTHHPWWDPLAPTSSGAQQFVEWIDQQNLSLLNSPGDPTFFRPNLERGSVIDLTLATENLANKIQDWQILPDLGSDHFGILFTIQGTTQDLVNTPIELGRFNTKLADWELFTSTLQNHGFDFDFPETVNSQVSFNLLQKNNELSNILDKSAEEFTKAITKAAEASIPQTTPGARAKAWWNPALKDLRKDMMWKQRNISNSQIETKLLYLQAKNLYFQEIKKAKRDHWNQFLEKEDPQTIFKAMSYTKDRRIERIPQIQSIRNPKLEDSFEGKCSAFRQTLFPPPPTAPDPQWDNYRSLDWNWPTLTKVELETACSAKVKGKTPGPDSITQEIILQAYKAIPVVFYKLYSTLINTGYHPKCWKQATGAILKKPGKPDYSKPKAYRVISLLNCLGKVSERILAQRLGYLAETTTLLHPSQIGGRLRKSAIDAALLLTTEIETNKRLKRKTSTLFLDVKGAFDHVAKNQLLAILQRLRLPISLISWTNSFLNNRTLRLSFDGQTEKFSTINTGIPQGSPISPILFLIYIRDLFPSMAVKILSYIDDIALTVSSTSLKKNIRILEREVTKIYQLGAVNAIQFDLDKTELIHFINSAKAKTATLKLPNGETVQPKEIVRWLGIWFDSGLTFKQHIAIRVSQARSAFYRMNRLANTERGLSPFSMRQLYQACVTSIADYGSIVWWKGQTQFKNQLQALQNLALRKILGVFKTTPIIPMEVEAALLPPDIRLNASIRQYAFRVLKLSPNHPINKEIAQWGYNSFRPIQLQRIKNSISGCFDNNPIEKILPFNFPPWKRDIPFSVEISKLSKEDTTLVHNQYINQQRSKNLLAIYTDASSMPQGTGIGVGLVAINYSQGPGKPIYKGISNLGSSQLVYNGELEGVTQAFEYTATIAQPGQQVRIYSDNQAGIYRLKTPSDNPGQSWQIRTLNAAQQIKDKGASIILSWVPGHTEIVGNEMADSLAKEATTLYPTEPETTSFALLGLKIKQTNSVEWRSTLEKYGQKPNSNPTTYHRKFNWKISSKLQLPLGTKRELASSFYQLKFSHGYLKSYLFKRGHTTNNKCRCGQPETSEHLLLSCTELKEARKELRAKLPELRLSLSILLHTKQGIVETLNFLRKTGIATKKWHLNRRDEERGE